MVFVVMLVVLVLESQRSFAGTDTQKMLMLLRGLVASTSSRGASFVTQSSQTAQAHCSSRAASGAGVGGFKRNSASLDTQEILMLLRGLVASTPSGAAGFVTQSSAPTGSAAASQSSTEGSRSISTPGTCP